MGTDEHHTMLVPQIKPDMESVPTVKFLKCIICKNIALLILEQLLPEHIIEPQFRGNFEETEFIVTQCGKCADDVGNINDKFKIGDNFMYRFAREVFGDRCSQYMDYKASDIKVFGKLFSWNASKDYMRNHPEMITRHIDAAFSDFGDNLMKLRDYNSQYFDIEYHMRV